MMSIRPLPYFNMNAQNQKPTLYLMVGIVGSGKSTYAAKFALRNNCEIVCPDDIREELTGDIGDQSKNKEVFAMAETRARYFLTHDTSVLVDATCYNKKNRKTWQELAKSLQIRIVAVVMEAPFDICRERNQKRKRVVPDFVIDKQIAGYQEPTLEEFDAILRIPAVQKV